MKKLIGVFWLLILFIACAASSNSDDTNELYYAIIQDDVVCGYAHVVFEPVEYEERTCTLLTDSLWMQMKAMGKSIEGQYTFTYTIDQGDGMYLHHTSDIKQGTLEFAGLVSIHGDSAISVSIPEMDTSVVIMPPETLCKNTRLYQHLVNFFIRDGLTEKKCPVFSEIDNKVNTIVYTTRGQQQIKLVGKTYDALVVDALNRTTGIQTTIWVDTESGIMLKEKYPQREVELADADIRNKMGVADIDKNLFVPVDTVIANPWALSYVKVQAVMQPAGFWLTPENLNVPGQNFYGTVENNRVEGMFEINHDRYDGSNAPSFPCDFSNSESLAEYLEPSNMIESDDPAIVAKAIEITKGAKDAWDAAVRLSQWVNEEIGYDVPGGGTAAKTFELRLGECGSHSNLLTAFCRAVGIPARGVFGCMYVPEHGGVFGQHAWNEVYMGDAGWIPIECTADEVSYVDCGHIRLGEWESMAMALNAKEVELLEFRVGDGDYADLVSTADFSYDEYVGKYKGPDKVMTVKMQENRLALDIPGQMVFQLKDPDEDGEWFFVLTDRVSVSFKEDVAGNAKSMVINSRQRMPRDSEADKTSVDDAVPEQYHPYIGSYPVPMQNATLIIDATDDGLQLVYPGNQIIPLRSGDNDIWIGDTGKSMLHISFEQDTEGAVTAMHLSELVTCQRID